DPAGVPPSSRYRREALTSLDHGGRGTEGLRAEWIEIHRTPAVDPPRGRQSAGVQVARVDRREGEPTGDRHRLVRVHRGPATELATRSPAPAVGCAACREAAAEVPARGDAVEGEAADNRHRSVVQRRHITGSELSTLVRAPAVRASVGANRTAVPHAGGDAGEEVISLNRNGCRAVRDLDVTQLPEHVRTPAPCRTRGI